MIEKTLKRSEILPEPDLPDANELMAQGRELARQVRVGSSPFLAEHHVVTLLSSTTWLVP